jgi:septum formation protein
VNGLPTLVLASSSPRRRHLLEMLGIPFIAQPADVQELPLPRELPEAYARRLARDKARAVPGSLVLGADTIVVLDDEILEKPADPEHAVAMLSRLQGRTHHVITAVCLVSHGVERVLADRTAVTMRPADEPLLRAYVATGEPLDKAGSYGIQGPGAALIERVEGDFFSVMGLPIRLVLTLLAEAGHEYRFSRDERRETRDDRR